MSFNSNLNYFFFIAHIRHAALCLRFLFSYALVFTSDQDIFRWDYLTLYTILYSILYVYCMYCILDAVYAIQSTLIVAH